MQRYFEKMRPYLKKGQPQVNVIVMQHHPAGGAGVMATGLDGMTAGQGQGPNVPQHMVQTQDGPHMLHADEGTMQKPDGSVQVVPQRVLHLLEQSGGQQPGVAPQQPPQGQPMPQQGGLTNPMSALPPQMPGSADGGTVKLLYPFTGPNLINDQIGFRAAPMPGHATGGSFTTPQLGFNLMPGHADGGVVTPEQQQQQQDQQNQQNNTQNGTPVPATSTTGTTTAKGNITPLQGTQTGYNAQYQTAIGGSPAVAAAAQTARSSQAGTNIANQGVQAQINASSPFATTGALNAATARTAIGGEGAMADLNAKLNQNDLTARENAQQALINNAPALQSQLTATSKALTDYLQSAKLANPNFNWQGDPQAVKLNHDAFVAAGSPGGDEKAWGITQEAIRTHIDTSNDVTVDNAFDWLKKSGAITQQLSMPNGEAEVRAAISKAILGGGLISDGKGGWTITNDFQLPWDNAESFFEYEDFTGADLPAGSNPDTYYTTGEVAIKTIGTYQAKDATGANKTVNVSQAQVYSAFKKLTSDEKQLYYKDGKFQAQDFIRDHINPIGTEGGINIVNASDFEDVASTPGSALYNKYNLPTGDEWKVAGTQLSDDHTEAGAITVTDQNGFKVDVTNQLPFLWYQFNQHTGGDKTFDEFKRDFLLRKDNLVVDGNGKIQWDAKPLINGGFMNIVSGGATQTFHGDSGGTGTTWTQAAHDQMTKLVGKKINIGGTEWTLSAVSNVADGASMTSNTTPLVHVTKDGKTLDMWLGTDSQWHMGDGSSYTLDPKTGLFTPTPIPTPSITPKALTAPTTPTAPATPPTTPTDTLRL